MLGKCFSLTRHQIWYSFMAVEWRFLAFQYSVDSRPVDAWQQGLEVDSFNVFADLIGRLRLLPRINWIRPGFDVLHGAQYHGMGKIRFKGDHKVYRVFGWFGPGRTQLRFTLLHGCKKQSADLTSEYEVARKRRDIVISLGEGYLYEFAVQRKPHRKPEG